MNANNPYATASDLPMEERTSIMAVLSCVCGVLAIIPVLCCVTGPTLGLVGGGLGVFALIAISNANGRLGGKRLAIAGVVMSLIGFLVSVIVLVGVMSSAGPIGKAMNGLGDGVLRSVEDGKFDETRAQLAPNVAAVATDEVLSAFRTQYQAELGKYTRAPDGLGEWFSTLMKHGQRIQQYTQGRQDVVPGALFFEKGDALVIIYLDAGFNPNPSGSANASILNVKLVTIDGQEFDLVPESAINPGAAAPAVNPEVVPEAPAAPKAPGAP